MLLYMLCSLIMTCPGFTTDPHSACIAHALSTASSALACNEGCAVMNVLRYLLACDLQAQQSGVASASGLHLAMPHRV